MKLVSLLPVLLLIGGIAAKTNFKVNGTFYCDYNAWCFFVTLWEEDTSEYWNDVIDTMGTKCVFGRHSYFYELDGTEYEDGPFDDYYEIFLTVRHNCTSYGKRELRRETTFESVKTAVSYTTWNVKLTGDRGELKDEFV
ncbi:hypothetical protein L5515_019521 [Caenorhabditis briggsae]|uniref:Uncharacterized protein n=1 Tax=Caenorhabditis briggsae TaxID=6238 RepID=A0AAE9JTY3_CAEBR|nr:hypothetical protein L5515_019521 [Caenorhabditis briggsae]